MKVTDYYDEGAGLTDRRRIRKGRALLGAALLLTALGLMLPRTSAAGGWGYTAGPLGTARRGHTATLLPDGKVLVAGGYDGSNYLNSAELYNPKTGRFSPTGAMVQARQYATATLLGNGKVLVAGGCLTGGWDTLATAELYDPQTGTWSTTGSLKQGRYSHTASLLDNGDVLVAGGRDYYYDIASAEIYDPGKSTWSFTGSLQHSRCNHTATAISGYGKVLVAGGQDFKGTSLNSVEVYVSDRRQWVQTGYLNQARAHHAATLLRDGRVLVVGAFPADAYGGVFIERLAELYHPGTGTWSYTARLSYDAPVQYPLNALTATLLPNGKVLVAGGCLDSYPLRPYNYSEIYNPANDAWSCIANLNSARAGHTATLLDDGLVLVVGGWSNRWDNQYSLSSAEIYPRGLGFPPSKPNLSGINLLLLD